MFKDADLTGGGLLDCSSPSSYKIMPKRTYQASKRTRKKQFGFRARMKTENGRDILRRRRRAGRKRLVPKGVEVHFKRHVQQHT